jgi:hypothetical protein
LPPSKKKVALSKAKGTRKAKAAYSPTTDMPQPSPMQQESEKKAGSSTPQKRLEKWQKNSGLNQDELRESRFEFASDRSKSKRQALVSKLRGILHLGTLPTLEIPPIETIDSHDHQTTPAGNGGQSDGDDKFFNSLEGEITGFYQGALDNVNEGGYCNDENDDDL